MSCGWVKFKMLQWMIVWRWPVYDCIKKSETFAVNNSQIRFFLLLYIFQAEKNSHWFSVLSFLFCEILEIAPFGCSCKTLASSGINSYTALCRYDRNCKLALQRFTIRISVISITRALFYSHIDSWHWEDIEHLGPPTSTRVHRVVTTKVCCRRIFYKYRSFTDTVSSDLGLSVPATSLIS